MRIFTNEEAFAPLADEKSIPIDMGMHDFQFTRRWFMSRNIKTWSTFFPQKFDNSRPINILQIGVFEGMDLVWCMQNIAGHPTSRVVAIDPWAGTGKISDEDMEAVHQRAVHNLSPWKNQIALISGYSKGILPSLSVSRILVGDDYIKSGEYDLIVIDGDHTADAVFSDATYAYDLVRTGGWMVFDDVRNRVYKKDHVVHGLERFVDGRVPRSIKFEWMHRYCDCWSKT